MDEKFERARLEVVDDRLAHAAVQSADRLATSVAMLRARVRSLVPQDQGHRPDPIYGIRGSLERVKALEQLLSRSRAREDHLTTQTIQDQAMLAELEARIAELEGMEAVAAVTESARVDAEERSADAGRRLALVEAELRARLAELSSLRSRCEAFEKDLDVLAEEAAMAAARASRAARLEVERDEARERASTERQLAAQDRERAEEAERRANLLQEDLVAMPRELADGRELNRRIEVAHDSLQVLQPVGAPSPWVELQHLASAAATFPTGSESPEAYEVEDSGDWLFDLSEAESAAEEQAPEEPVAFADGAPLSVGAIRSEGGGPLRRFWSKHRPMPASGGPSSSTS